MKKQKKEASVNWVSKLRLCTHVVGRPPAPSPVCASSRQPYPLHFAANTYTLSPTRPPYPEKKTKRRKPLEKHSSRVTNQYRSRKTARSDGSVHPSNVTKNPNTVIKVLALPLVQRSPCAPLLEYQAHHCRRQQLYPWRLGLC